MTPPVFHCHEYFGCKYTCMESSELPYARAIQKTGGILEETSRLSCGFVRCPTRFFRSFCLGQRDLEHQHRHYSQSNS